MMEKIEWYQEVLELEPSSKVFFPLARLLQSNNQPEEAVATLKQGLDRHPEFFEARLMLIDLLEKCGRKEEAVEQVERLGGKLSLYPGFWQAWAGVCERQGKTEISVALRLMAAFLSGRGITLFNIIQSGLNSVMAQGQTAQSGFISCDSAQAEAPATGLLSGEPAAGECIAGEMSESAAAETEEIFSQTGADEPLASDFAAATEPASDAEPDSFSSDMGEAVSVQPDEMAFESEEPAELPDMEETQPGELAAAELQLSAVELAGMDIDEPEVATLPQYIPEVGADAEIEDEASIQSSPVSSEAVPVDMPAPQLIAADDKSAIRALIADSSEQEAEEEPFSLRTKTMAGLLVEQGDLLGALEIYEELLAAAATADAQAELQSRIDSLKKKMKGAEPVASPKTEENEEPLHGKEKLLDALENLARRLEVRAGEA
ncbi:MAG: tetratricopeptide repeat protein [Desulfovibrionaceae bacterium]|nr:tetratricopeptide repeat protein [Desulfovibrionaceae bacterium]